MARNPEATTLTLVRHTISEANKKGKIAGRWDVPACTEGRELARKRRPLFQSRPTHTVLSSESNRAFVTAEDITGESAERIRTTPLLLERAYGPLEGDKPPEEVREDLAVLADFWRTDFSRRRRLRPVEGMETDEELLERWRKFKKEITDEHAGQNVLAVSHCDFMMTVLQSKGVCVSPEVQGIVNTGFVVFRSVPEAPEPTFRVERINGLVRRRKAS